MPRDPRTIGVVLGDDAPMLEIAVPERVFGLAVPGGPAFEVVAVPERPGPLTTSAGIRVSAPHPLEALDRAGMVIVPGWREPDRASAAPPVLEALLAAHADGAIVVGLCLGAFVLAEAGLLDGRRATTHWRHTADLAAGYPGVAVVDDALYVDEGTIVTSAGSAAGIDACLYLLRREHGAAVANAVARALVVAPQRTGGQAQFIERPVPEPPVGDAISDAVAYALAHLDDPRLDVARLAAAAHMSRRTFDRRFRQSTGVSPLRWLLTQRVLRAQHLLESTDLGVDAVARRSGFSDGVALRPHFRRLVGVPPQAYRNAFRAT
ncbi:AraC family transcriptional regulator [Actinomadura sp. NBRC 104425]|uniref:GlxA family transcriptional regulator n=1 Tax=Actinomadura sp. NBRC 104425 TaxID=3032204 RepID=UPI0024A3E45C|nr:helix-turn-helix domain-containing protein [Actinomadura sp. NBRC 104425]GLZ10702.1 AraC family transcriptional regulator [Actinomadura sp. NBRC 104425]